jgi:Stm1
MAAMNTFALLDSENEDPTQISADIPSSVGTPAAARPAKAKGAGAHTTIITTNTVCSFCSPVRGT